MRRLIGSLGVVAPLELVSGGVARPHISIPVGLGG